MAKKHGLGRGLGALIKDGTESPGTASTTQGTRQIAIDRIEKNRFQPRNHFHPDGLEELTRSIREHGVLQPLLVRSHENRYELIAGERRLRAATEAGLKQVPVVILNANDMQALEIALVENLQRENLDPMEEAEGYHMLAEQFHLTQEQIAQQVGKGRTTIANALRLLDLPDEIKRFVADGALSAGHAKVLSGIERVMDQLMLARRSIEDGLSVRALEQQIKRMYQAPRKTRAARADLPKQHVEYLSDQLHARFGTAVHLTPCRTYANGKKAKGTVQIDFYSNEDLDRILCLLGVETNG